MVRGSSFQPGREASRIPTAGPAGLALRLVGARRGHNQGRAELLDGQAEVLGRSAAGRSVKVAKLVTKPLRSSPRSLTAPVTRARPRNGLRVFRAGGWQR